MRLVLVYDCVMPTVGPVLLRLCFCDDMERSGKIKVVLYSFVSVSVYGVLKVCLV